MFLQVHTSEIYLMLVLICLIDFLGQTSMTIAMQSESSSFVAIIGFMIVVYGYVVEQLLFSEAIGGAEMLNAFFIVGVTLSTALYKIKTRKRNDTHFIKV